MQIALPISGTSLNFLNPSGCLTVPDLPDLIEKFEHLHSGKPFSMCYKTEADILPIADCLRAALYREMKLADRVLVDECTIFVMEQLPACKNQQVFLYAGSKPRQWAVGFKYRTDVDWWLVIKAGKFLEPEFLGQPITLLLQTGDLNHWLHATHFFSECLFNLVVNHPGNDGTLPAVEIFPFLERLLKTQQLVPLFESLRNVNFFQVLEKETSGSHAEDFSIQVNTSPQAWTETEQMMEVLYPQFFKSGGAISTCEAWERFKLDKRSVVLLARSNLPDIEDSQDNEGVNFHSFQVSQVPLGVLVGGIHPTSQTPHILAVCVIPDERRRKIGTGLVRRFFAHTAYKEVQADLQIKRNEEPYEIAAFFDSLNGVLRKKLISTWVFRLVNPFLK